MMHDLVLQKEDQGDTGDKGDKGDKGLQRDPGLQGDQGAPADTYLISQIQAAVEELGAIVIHHRAAFHSMAERQAGEDGAWEGSAPVNGKHIWAGCLGDNNIPVPVPVFNWPWMMEHATS